jgi:hypothetical protein
MTGALVQAPDSACAITITRGMPAAEIAELLVRHVPSTYVVEAANDAAGPVVLSFVAAPDPLVPAAPGRGSREPIP